MAAQANDAEASAELIWRTAAAFMAAKHLFVANEVGVFTTLAEGPRTLDDVAARIGIPRRTLRIVADAMVALGFVRRHDDQYANAPATAAFLAGKSDADLRPLLRFWNHISYPAWLHLEAAVRSGRAQTRHGAFSAEEQQLFSQGVEALTAGTAQALATTYDFSRHRRLLDLGGGTGSFLVAVLRRYPRLEATLFELPTVAPLARDRLAGDPASRQAAVVAGDFQRDPLPAGHDAVLIANVLHLFSPEHNRALLRRVRAHVPDGSHLLLVDVWTDPTHTRPALAALMAAEFLLIAGEGDVYSEEEVRGWLEETGWRLLERHRLDALAGLLVAATA